MAVTIKQISELSGVSRGTVDRVPNTRGHVAPEKAALVRQVAQQLGYQPNMAGKALAARKKSYSIGVLLCSKGNPFFEEVIRGVRAAEKELTDFGVRIQLQTVKGYDDQQLKTAMQEMATNVNALVLTPVNSKIIADEIDTLTASGIPVIMVNTDIEGSRRACYVGSDYMAGGRVACGILRLLTDGQAHLGMLTGSLRVLGHNQRIAGFREIMKRDCPGFTLSELETTEDDDIIGYENTKRMLISHPEIDALFLVAAGIYGVCRAVQDVRRNRMPKIVCFDATPQVRELMQDGIVQAAIDQQPFRQGYESVQTAYQCLLTGKLPRQDRILMESRILIRESL